MRKTIRAKYSKGIIKPLDKVDLTEGEEVLVAIMETPSGLKREAFRRAAGAWKGNY